MEGLPHDLQYCLDCMTELHEITGDIYEYFFSVKPKATEFLDVNGTDSKIMLNDYMDWRKKAKPIQKAYLTLSGIETLKHQIHDYTMAVTNDAIIKNKRKPTQKMLTESLTIGIVQERFVKNFERLYFQAKQDFNDVTIRDVIDYNEQIKLQRNKFYQANHPWLYRDSPVEKKVLKKSIALMGNFFTPEDTKLFLGKKEVTITGTNFDFSIKSENMTSMFHGTLKISVLDKSGKFLTNLCFYYDNMPAPDQITAFLLDVKSGNENEIIKVGNMYNQTEHVYENKLLCDLKDLHNKKEKIENFFQMDIGQTIENHLEKMIPGSKFIHKYHDVTMPITKKIINKFYKEKMRIFENLLMNYSPRQLEGY